MKMKIAFLVIPLILASVLPAGQDPEKIYSYDSRIRVNPDGSMIVTETVRVNCRGDRIRRGIYRDFPTRYRDGHGKWVVVKFQPLEILRDGNPEPWHMENRSNGKRVYIGSSAVYLEPGEYTYSICYETDRQLGFHKDFDELYWNVTGNGWEFVIDRASACVELPPYVSEGVIGYEGYTGPQGSREKNLSMYREPWSSHICFETTRPLSPREGLTIVVNWKKGLIPEPSAAEKAGNFARDNLGLFIGILGSILLLAYYLIDWFRVGKDPEKGTIIPLFFPPNGLSPAILRYIRDKKYGHKAFTAALINLAVKGAIRIHQTKRTYSIAKESSTGVKWSPEEKRIYDALLADNREFEFKTGNHSKIQNAIKGMKTVLERDYQKTYFMTNRRYFWFGSLISLAILGLCLVTFPDKSALGILFFLGIWSIGVFFLVSRIVLAVKALLTQKSGRAVAFGGLIFFTLFSIPFLAGEVFALWGLSQVTSPLWFFIILALLVINGVFFRLMEAYTPAGRRLMDQIEGFQQYLSVTEGERLRLMNPPRRTPQLFEDLLPYAIALDVEKEWAKQFEQVLARAARDGSYTSPAWYSGSSWNPAKLGAFTSSVGSSFSSAISSSSTPPGSSSGSGGGGSSGGGGGGGGGGGW
ncbi:DUF2207 domain-containing protein [bacterium]|nr:DUF2207 domain-containing protein [bacterium]